MVATQIAARGIRNPALLAAMCEVPRVAFVPAMWRDCAYDDAPLPIGHGQTISQPYIVALMLEAAAIDPSDRVLEIGAGSGYATAIASLLARYVYAVERHRALAAQARERLQALGYAGNVELRCGDGSGGWPEAAPFDVIVVSAGAPRVPSALRAQLGPGGRLVLPVGPEPRAQRLLKIVRTSATHFDEEALCNVRFVPLIGTDAWSDTG